MATNHGFADGNKRTTLILTHLLIEKSGYRLTAKGGKGALQDEIERMILGVVEHKLTFDDVVEWFSERLVKM